jgi:hypothetical protein
VRLPGRGASASLSSGRGLRSRSSCCVTCSTRPWPARCTGTPG